MADTLTERIAALELAEARYNALRRHAYDIGCLGALRAGISDVQFDCGFVTNGWNGMAFDILADQFIDYDKKQQSSTKEQTE